MPQKYKVFFNNNKLFIAKEHLSKIDFQAVFTNPNQSDIKGIVAKLFKENTSVNYLITTDDLEKTWLKFCLLFEIRKAAGGVVINNKNEKLFIKRKGFWDLPKGHVEKNEKNRAAAIREVMEECGIEKPVIVKKLVKTYHTYVLKKRIVLKPTKWYLMSYLGDKKTKPQKKEGITKAVWANKEAENEMIKNTYSAIIEVLDKANAVGFSFGTGAF